MSEDITPEGQRFPRLSREEHELSYLSTGYRIEPVDKKLGPRGPVPKEYPGLACLWPLRHCPYREQGTDPETGETIPVRCRSNRCIFCAPINAIGLAGAIALAKPDTCVTLTALPDTWAATREALKKYLRTMRENYGRFEWVHMVEENPQATGLHLHAWSRSDHRLDQGGVGYAASRAGLGAIVYVKEMRLPEGLSVTYGLKAVRNIPRQSPDQGRYDLDVHLAHNGGRLLHATHQFWLDDTGQHTTARKALTAFRRLRNNQNRLDRHAA